MKDSKTPITDQYLESLTGLKPAETKGFFYERLKSRMASKQPQQPDWVFPFKPVWTICTLALLLIINTIILTQKNKPAKTDDQASLESFAAAYDQNISSY